MKKREQKLKKYDKKRKKLNSWKECYEEKNMYIRLLKNKIETWKDVVKEPPKISSKRSGLLIIQVFSCHCVCVHVCTCVECSDSCSETIAYSLVSCKRFLVYPHQNLRSRVITWKMYGVKDLLMKMWTQMNLQYGAYSVRMAQIWSQMNLLIDVYSMRMAGIWSQMNLQYGVFCVTRVQICRLLLFRWLLLVWWRNSTGVIKWWMVQRHGEAWCLVWGETGTW